jgi:hypothetical protein
MTYVIMAEGEECIRVNSIEAVRAFFDEQAAYFYEDKKDFPAYYEEDSEPDFGDYEVFLLVEEIGVPSYDEEQAARKGRA